jgi:hypothetical protein
VNEPFRPGPSDDDSSACDARSKRIPGRELDRTDCQSSSGGPLIPTNPNCLNARVGRSLTDQQGYVAWRDRTAAPCQKAREIVRVIFGVAQRRLLRSAVYSDDDCDRAERHEDRPFKLLVLARH